MWALHWTFLIICWLISIYLYALHTKMLARAMYMLLTSAASYNPSYIQFFLAASMLSLLLLRDSLLWIGRGWCTKLYGKSSRALCMLLTRWQPELHLKQPKTNRMQQRCDRLLKFFFWESPFWCIAFNFYVVTPTWHEPVRISSECIIGICESNGGTLPHLKIYCLVLLCLYQELSSFQRGQTQVSTWFPSGENNWKRWCSKNDHKRTQFFIWIGTVLFIFICSSVSYKL